MKTNFEGMLTAIESRSYKNKSGEIINYHQAKVLDMTKGDTLEFRIHKDVSKNEIEELVPKIDYMFTAEMTRGYNNATTVELVSWIPS